MSYPFAMCLVFFALIVSLFQVKGETFNCTEGGCGGETLECTEHEECVFNCLGSGACKSSFLSCKNDYDCTINCDIAPGDTSILDKACEGVTIGCPERGNCFISAIAEDAMNEAYIECPNDCSCHIYAKGDYSLIGSTIYAIYAESLYYHGYGALSSANTQIHVPIDRYDASEYTSIPTVITAYDSSSSLNYVDIYSIEGFYGIKIDDHTSNGSFSNTFMHCGDDYEHYCLIDADFNNIDNNPIAHCKENSDDKTCDDYPMHPNTTIIYDSDDSNEDSGDDIGKPDNNDNDNDNESMIFGISMDHTSYIIVLIASIIIIGAISIGLGLFIYKKCCDKTKYYRFDKENEP